MNNLLTKYAPKPTDPILIEYPRPQMRRDSYLNLNGFWDFEISKNETITHYTKRILVPFSPESILSTINQLVDVDDYAFYRKMVELPEGFMKDRLIIHFGAVDQTCDVYINQTMVLTHVGGYVPFSIDITDAIDGSSFELSLRVKDITDTTCHLTGKQRLLRGGIFYTQQSGIWQTVWLESVCDTYIKDIKLIPNFDAHAFELKVDSDSSENLSISVYFKEVHLTTVQTPLNSIQITLDEFHPWTPEVPNLYDLVITLGNDTVYSYVGIRKFERKVDQFGIMRFYLNNQPYFQSGVLDQGYYSDGLLTPPSDQAMIDDILTMKNLGFNMLRKHIKMEPLRWYYHCDRLGMLVWQDMMSGTENKDVVFHHVLSIFHIHLSDRFKKRFGRTQVLGKQLYEKDLETMLHTLKNVCSICTWVPFNEAWGQFDTKRICHKIESLDPTRLVDHASGWSDHGVGDYHSRHIYYQKIRFYKFNARKRILALTEFGGYSLPVQGHRFNDDSIFGYKIYTNDIDFRQALQDLYLNKLKKSIECGLSVLIYTQLSDVEDEVNGFLTYDRDVLKVSPVLMKDIHQKLFDLFEKKVSGR